MPERRDSSQAVTYSKQPKNLVTSILASDTMEELI